MNSFYSKLTAAFKWQQIGAGWARIPLTEMYRNSMYCLITWNYQIPGE